VKTTSGASLDEIEAAYEAGAAQFCRVAAAIVGDRETARDVVQEAFARAVRERHGFRRDSPLEAWLWRIVINEARTLLRRTDRATASPDPAAHGSNGVGPGDTAIRAAVSLLPERQRLMLFLRYYADLDYREIAAVCAVSQGTVLATLNAARATLRSRLEEVPR
jgi:DNA-directed RNA polymerase specialized sigma24 family protein